MRILLVEDDPRLADALCAQLEPFFAVDKAANGHDATYMAEINAYDVIILDLTLPDTTGDVVCSTLRQQNIRTPILILTGRDSVADKVRVLDAGADDYLTKPFNFEELLARVRALLRRSYGNPLDGVLRVEDLELDPNSRTVTRAGKEIQLRRKEMDLLEYMMRNSGRVVTRGMILEHVWDSTANAFTNAIDVHVKYIRDQVDRPFENKLIHTVYGLGYRIGPPAAHGDVDSETLKAPPVGKEVEGNEQGSSTAS